ncbi:MAG: 50S ribosomal protein L21e [archaeon]
MQHSRGFRAKSRYKLSGGRFSIAEALQEFKPGDRVRVNINPAVHKGMPHPRFQAADGCVVEKRGRSFRVEVNIGNATKQILVKPEHLKPLK